MEEIDFTPVEDTTPPPAEESETHAEPEELSEKETEAASQTETESEDSTDGNAHQAQAEDEKTQAEEPYLTIKYNHEEQNFTREEAATYIQKAMKEQNKLEYLAAQNGETVSQLVDRIIKASDDNYRDSLISEYGDKPELIEQLMKSYHNSQKERYEKMLNDRAADAAAQKEQAEKSLNERMAAELSEVQGIFPEIKQFNDLPKSVRDNALKGGDLLKEYLKHRHSEQLKIEKNKAAEQKAAAASGGSMQSTADIDTAADDFAKGAWGK